jgi:hypothetical protein
LAAVLLSFKRLWENWGCPNQGLGYTLKRNVMSALVEFLLDTLPWLFAAGLLLGLMAGA